ncbi:HNH endonuclease [Sphingomonas sp.]|uniref:HNH endonuclease n=1 Tax=Sphingomonas sp. TaxID=28214 RepID=UPI001B2EE949|nr:HNH endonuclease [Sphingomonas sp.]MBO9712471.1 HNH endonuclease [Sphingomonas sp.]
MRSPDWSRDELILALQAYLAITPRAPSPTAPEVVALSAELRARAADTVAEVPNYRSVDSVVMKLMNFRNIDPEFAGKGLERAGTLDRTVWADFGRDVAAVAAAAAKVRGGASRLPAPAVAGASEGELIPRNHLERERDAGLAASRKAVALLAEGRLACETCGFDFEAAYGPRGRGVIDCHHLTPLSEYDGVRETRSEDLALLCANCHRMIHSRRPWLSLDELRVLLAGVRHLT